MKSPNRPRSKGAAPPGKKGSTPRLPAAKAAAPFKRAVVAPAAAPPVSRGAVRPDHFVLTKNLDRTIHAGHPWVFRDAVVGDVPAGRICTLLNKHGAFLARGVAENGPIAMRIWTTEDVALDEAFVRARIDYAMSWRDTYVQETGETTAHRWLNGEGDRLPGVMLDVYRDADTAENAAVLRLDGAIGELEFVVDAVHGLIAERGIDTLLLKTGRRHESRITVVSGTAPAEPLLISEYGMRLLVDVVHGQKTGLFLDHRESRRRIRSLSQGKKVLNLYSYTGGFSIAAGLGGATSVTSVDIAESAIGLARESWIRNGLGDIHNAVVSDVPAFLEGQKESYDLIVSDPPSFAPNEASKEAAMAAYTALHIACLQRLTPGGVYLAASCSSHVRGEDFLQTLRNARIRTRRPLQILDRWNAAADHPHLLELPEANYLDCVLVREVP